MKMVCQLCTQSSVLVSSDLFLQWGCVNLDLCHEPFVVLLMPGFAFLLADLWEFIFSRVQSEVSQLKSQGLTCTYD